MLTNITKNTYTVYLNDKDYFVKRPQENWVKKFLSKVKNSDKKIGDEFDKKTYNKSSVIMGGKFEGKIHEKIEQALINFIEREQEKIKEQKEDKNVRLAYLGMSYKVNFSREGELTKSRLVDSSFLLRKVDYSPASMKYYYTHDGKLSLFKNPDILFPDFELDQFIIKIKRDYDIDLSGRDNKAISSECIDRETLFNKLISKRNRGKVLSELNKQNISSHDGSSYSSESETKKQPSPPKRRRVREILNRRSVDLKPTGK